MKKLLLAICIISLGLWACSGGGGKDEDKPTPKPLCDSVTFNTMVLPIFTKSCNLAGCHSQGAGGIDLRKYTTAKDACESGKMLPAINHTAGGVKNMPSGTVKLPKREIDIITCWMNKGYPL